MGMPMTGRYKAYISYSHQDEYWAQWLQQALERYRVPRQIRRERPGKNLPARLYPIFRDREELASSPDLTRSICSALDNSDALIVICSPQAARSSWVNDEIRYFQSLGRSRKIFCLQIAGNAERDAEDCAFPPALLNAEDGSQLPIPLAADVSLQADGKRIAVIKIAAALLDVGIDDLRHRDAQRQLRFRGLVASVSTIVAAVTMAFALAAVLARQEADIRRLQAESLISFMLEDLRGRLEPVGRLDLLDAVGNEAMEYFALLGNHGTEQEVFSRALALRQIGEVRFRQGQLAGALAAFEESRNIARTLVFANPDNSSYLYELGQAEFWIGYAALEQSHLDQTTTSFTRYMEYSRQLVLAEPENPDYQMELMYAYSNLGTVNMEAANPEIALEYFRQCLQLNLQLLEMIPGDLPLTNDLGNTYSWLGKANLQLGNLAESERAYNAALNSLLSLHETGENRIYSEHFGQNKYHLGNVSLHLGNVESAEALFSDARVVFDELMKVDPDNGIWRSDRGISAYHQAETSLLLGNQEQANGFLLVALSDFEQLSSKAPSDFRNSENLSLAQQLMAQIQLGQDNNMAMKLSRESFNRINALVKEEDPKPRTVLNFASVAIKHGQLMQAVGNMQLATKVWRTAFELLEASDDQSLLRFAIEQKLRSLLPIVGSDFSGASTLVEAGFQDPRYLVDNCDCNISAVASLTNE